MKTASIAEMKAHFSEYLRASVNAPVIVTRKGKPVAVVMAVREDEDLERLRMARSPQLQAILKAARLRIQAGQGIPSEQFWRQVASDRRTRATAEKRTRRRKKLA